MALLREAAHRRREEHGLAQVPDPVAGGPGPARAAGSPVTVESSRTAAGTGAEALEAGLQLGHQRVHVRAVGGHVHLHPAGEHLASLELGEQLLDRVGVARHDRRARAVAHGHREPAAVAADRLPSLVERQLHDGHRPAAGDALHQLAAPADDARGVLQGQRAGHVGRRHLAHAVPDDGRRLDAPRAPERGERHLHGEQRRLDHGDVVEPRPVRARRGSRRGSTSPRSLAPPRSQASRAARNAGTRSEGAADPCRATGSPGPGTRRRRAGARAGATAARGEAGARSRPRGRRRGPATRSACERPTTARRCSWCVRRAPAV